VPSCPSCGQIISKPTKRFFFCLLLLAQVVDKLTNKQTKRFLGGGGQAVDKKVFCFFWAQVVDKLTNKQTKRFFFGGEAKISFLFS